MLLELCHTQSKNLITLFNVYVPVNFQEKRDCWKSQVVFLDDNSFSNIIVASDLNLIMDTKEKKGGVHGRDPMLNMVENRILSWELIDFKPKKGRYTWSNNGTGATHISARLDRFLV